MDLTAPALFSAHRFFKAAMIAALPAALSFLLGLEAGTTSKLIVDSPLAFAHLRCWPCLIRRNVAGLILRFAEAALGSVDGATLPPFSMARRSAICASIGSFWPSKPLIAASIICLEIVGI
jgi:hypothetical protein